MTADELARLRKENAALRDLLAAIHEGQVPFPTEDGWLNEMRYIEARRLDMITIQAGAHDAVTPDYLWKSAALLRERWAESLPYTPARGYRIGVDRGYYKLPAGHPGDEHKDPAAGPERGVCLMTACCFRRKLVQWSAARPGIPARNLCGCVACDEVEQAIRAKLEMPALHPERIVRKLHGHQEKWLAEVAAEQWPNDEYTAIIANPRGEDAL